MKALDLKDLRELRFQEHEFRHVDKAVSWAYSCAFDTSCEKKLVILSSHQNNTTNNNEKHFARLALGVYHALPHFRFICPDDIIWLHTNWLYYLGLAIKQQEPLEKVL